MNGHPVARRGMMGAVPLAKPTLETTQLNNHDRIAAVWGPVVGGAGGHFFSVGAVYVPYLDCEDGFSGVYIYQHFSNCILRICVIYCTSFTAQ